RLLIVVMHPVSCYIILHSFFQSYSHLRALHSFPTRRSSDLHDLALADGPTHTRISQYLQDDISNPLDQMLALEMRMRLQAGYLRSEEHTSELQSPDHLVCRLLLEKKKINN